MVVSPLTSSTLYSFFFGDSARRPSDFISRDTNQPDSSDKDFAAAIGLPFRLPEDVFVLPAVRGPDPSPGRGRGGRGGCGGCGSAVTATIVAILDYRECQGRTRPIPEYKVRWSHVKPDSWEVSAVSPSNSLPSSSELDSWWTMLLLS